MENGVLRIMKDKIKWSQIAVGNYTYPLYSFCYFLDSMKRLGIKNIEVWAAGPHLYLDDMTVSLLENNQYCHQSKRAFLVV